jgi:hypothetical protein
MGPYGSDKTQLLHNLILKWMRLDKRYLVAMSVKDQQCYQVLKDFNESSKMINSNDVFEFITDIDEAPSVEDIDGSITI